MDISPTTLWLIAGVALVIAEALGASGFGLIFAGLGALTVGITLSAGLIGEEALLPQFTIGFFATVLWAALLWKPLQKLMRGKGMGYNNMIGDTAYVSGNLRKGMPGEASWSGTVMKAELASDAPIDALESGAAAVIAGVRGATLILKPKT